PALCRARPARRPCRRTRPLARLGVRHPTLSPKHHCSMRELSPQVESERKFEAALLAWRVDPAGRMAVIRTPGETARFRLVRIDRFCFIITTARVRHVIDAAAQRPAVPGVDQVKGER